MGENGSSNTAIVAIVVLLLLGVGLFFYFGLFNKDTKVIEEPTKIIEKPFSSERSR